MMSMRSLWKQVVLSGKFLHLEESIELTCQESSD